jgi:hypothetical protein
VSVAIAYERISCDARYSEYSDVARAICAAAWAAGEPLRPLSEQADAEVLVVAECYGRAGADVTTALARARGEDIETACLHGVVRFAGARHEQDHLGAEFMERGIKSVRDLTREDAVDVARFLFSIPGDLVDEERALRDLEQMRATPEVVEPPRGAVLGGCFACASPVGDDDSTIGVRYFIAGRRRKDGTISDRRYEWRTLSPAVERGDYDSTDRVAKRAGNERRSELLRQARGGADLLCLACATRAKYGLLEWPDVDDGEDEDLDRQWREAVDRRPEDAIESDLAETDAVPPSAEPAAAIRPEPVAITWPDPHPLVDENVALEAAIFGTECSLVDSRRLDKVAAAYPEFMERRGALIVAITALAWERGRPLHLRTNPDDVGRLEQLCVLALNGASVDRALEKEAS